MRCELSCWANEEAKMDQIQCELRASPEFIGALPAAAMVQGCERQLPSHRDRERRAAHWQLVRTLSRTVGTSICKSLFYANDFLQMFWNVLTVLVWFSKTLTVWFEGTAAAPAAVNPPRTFLDIQQQQDLEKQIPIFPSKTRYNERWDQRWDKSTCFGCICLTQKREFPFCTKPCHFELTFQTKQEEKVNISINQNVFNADSEVLTSP